MASISNLNQTRSALSGLQTQASNKVVSSNYQLQANQVAMFGGVAAANKMY